MFILEGFNPIHFALFENPDPVKLPSFYLSFGQQTIDVVLVVSQSIRRLLYRQFVVTVSHSVHSSNIIAHARAGVKRGQNAAITF